MFYIVNISFILGIAFLSFFRFGLVYLYLIFLISLFLYIFIRRKLYLYITIFVIFFILGFLRFYIVHLDFKRLNKFDIGYYNGDTVKIIGIVYDYPDVRDKNVKYTFGGIKIVKNGNVNSVRGRLLAVFRLYPRFKFGDKVIFKCALKKPRPIDNFAYDMYLAKDGIFSVCYYPTLIDYQEERHLGFWIDIKKMLFNLKNKFIVQTNKLFPSPYSSLLTGILIGETSGIPKYLKDKFIQTGTIHITAMSGYNITVIISLFLIIAPYLYISRSLASIISIPFIFLFIIMSGSDSSVIRAGIFGFIMALSNYSGRVKNVNRVLVLSASLMLAANPYLLRFDLGFQLSFLAVLGILYITPVVDRLLTIFFSVFGKIRFNKTSYLKYIFKIIKDSFSTTVGANIAVAPILLLSFGRISIISPIANTLILWIVPFAMAFSFSSVLISFLFFKASQILSFAPFLALKYIISIVNILS